ncbi:MAG: GspE/PulE family protein [Phycisphaerales bacterium]
MSLPPSTAPDPAAVPSAEFLAKIPHEFARRHLILSRGRRDNTELLYTTDRTPPAAIWNTRTALQAHSVECQPADPASLASLIDLAYAAGQRDDDTSLRSLETNPGTDPDLDIESLLRDADLLSTQGKAPAVRLVDLLLFQALQHRASDLHLQPLNDRLLVRFRLDGVLHTVRELPAAAAAALVSRVKVMANLNVAEQRAPQDGRAGVAIGARRVDLRISTLPTTYGERVVIRLLDSARSPQELSFAALGMPLAVDESFRAQIARDSGIVLISGPTGSGKSTTLYASLAWLTRANSTHARGCEFNIMTIEDPVEYDLATSGFAISQTQVNPKRGVTFASGLRHILRQDPDVIMIGEIRDEETARIAVQASLTGHLVLSTLHTGDAPSAVARLVDLAVEPFLVSTSLLAVLAQRLVRTLHAPCAGRGCADCLSTGYYGRTGLFELLVLSDTLRELVAARAPTASLTRAAAEAGLQTLAKAGRDLVSAGRTTSQEVERIISGVEIPV